jgi:hypothetical protein
MPMFEWQITCIFRNDPASKPYCLHAPFAPFPGLRLGSDGEAELVIDTVRYNFAEAAFEVLATVFGTRESVERMLTAQAEREWHPVDVAGTTRTVQHPDGSAIADDDVPF